MRGYEVSLVGVPAGEASKSMVEAARVAAALVAARLDRHCFVVALGGGVVGDLAGFVASIYYRGIPVRPDTDHGHRAGGQCHRGEDRV